jgi:uncharacterized phage infection (PIP) family protein YhgE
VKKSIFYIGIFATGLSGSAGALVISDMQKKVINDVINSKQWTDWVYGKNTEHFLRTHLPQFMAKGVPNSVKDLEQEHTLSEAQAEELNKFIQNQANQLRSDIITLINSYKPQLKQFVGQALKNNPDLTITYDNLLRAVRALPEADKLLNKRYEEVQSLVNHTNENIRQFIEKYHMQELDDFLAQLEI